MDRQDRNVPKSSTIHSGTHEALGAIAVKNEVVTRATVSLALGCLPLAILTVASFAGIANLDSELPSVDERDLSPPAVAVSMPSPQELEGDVAVCSAVIEREFLAGGSLPERAVEAKPAFLESLPGDWKTWSDAVSLVKDVLAWELAQTGAGVPELEIARDRIGTIQDACRKKDPAGAALLIALLERQKEELQTEIASRKNSENAARLRRQAQQAFENKDYAATIGFCDQVLSRYGETEYQAVADLYREARFWQEWSKLPLETAIAEEPAKQRDALLDFLNRYRSMPNAPEQERIAQVTRRLDLVQGEIRRIEMNAGAEIPLAALATREGQDFPEQLAAATQVARTYPTDMVRRRLQERVILWLAASLPQKTLAEPDGIEEVETNSGEVLRGFFAAVHDAGGGVIGYKRYPTAEERKSPTRNAGRYPAADLRGAPTRSLPRQCVDAYESARRRLLADPGNREHWTAVQRTCESAETSLVDYRRKPGSSRDPVSFEKEGRFAQIVLAADVWTQMGIIWEQ